MKLYIFLWFTRSSPASYFPWWPSIHTGFYDDNLLFDNGDSSWSVKPPTPVSSVELNSYHHHCTQCVSGTAGPCRQANGMCWDMIHLGCPTGTTFCGDDEQRAARDEHDTPSMCMGCWPGTVGECKQSNTVCHHMSAIGTCPARTVACL